MLFRLYSVIFSVQVKYIDDTIGSQLSSGCDKRTSRAIGDELAHLDVPKFAKTGKEA